MCLGPDPEVHMWFLWLCAGYILFIVLLTAIILVAAGCSYEIICQQTRGAGKVILGVVLGYALAAWIEIVVHGHHHLSGQFAVMIGMLVMAEAILMVLRGPGIRYRFTPSSLGEDIAYWMS